MVRHDYALEHLYRDQDFDFVVDTVPSVLAWVPRTAGETQPFVFRVSHRKVSADSATTIEIALSWSEGELEKHQANTLDRATRLRTGRSADREHVTENAGYGLALVAISVLMPGRRVLGYRKGLCPDILLDDTPGSIRGVEAAARTTGGRAALDAVKRGNKESLGKLAQLIARTDVAEAHLSLWCAEPRIGDMLCVKP